MGEVTELLDKARAGEAGAWDRAVALVYQDLKRIARGVLVGSSSATLDATALVHECYERLARQEAFAVHNRAHFLALAARAMRQLMLNHARDKVAAKRGSGAVHIDVDEVQDAAFHEARHLLELDSALSQLESENAIWVRVVECRVFAGMTEQESADALEMSLRTAQRAFADARSRLGELLSE
jgi:RNA polymerase sigma factor (TIGR02999 family)